VPLALRETLVLYLDTLDAINALKAANREMAVRDPLKMGEKRKVKRRAARCA
jgi:hypothetical protein